MVDKSFWTIGFRNWHKRSSKVWIMAYNFKDCCLLSQKILKEKDLERVIRFQTKEEAEEKILRHLKLVKSLNIKETRSYVVVQIVNIEDAKSNKKGYTIIFH